ncbi:MAG: hypothetical protein QM751_10830 [Paludibacteraceae bacterium]
MGNKACYYCGEEQKSNFFGSKSIRLYYCQAPHCKMNGAFVCESCLVKFGSAKYTGLFQEDINVEKCPFCGIGHLKRVQ